jgi:phage tail-like protein
MPLPEPDSSVGYSFGLEIDGVVIHAIQEVGGLKMEREVIEMEENTPDGNDIISKLPGRPKAGELTLTRTLTSDSSFEKWFKAADVGKPSDARKGGAIIVYDYEGQALKRYKLTNAWPKSLELSTFKAGDTNLLAEKLTITYEALEPAD